MESDNICPHGVFDCAGSVFHSEHYRSIEVQTARSEIVVKGRERFFHNDSVGLDWWFCKGCHEKLTYVEIEESPLP